MVTYIVLFLMITGAVFILIASIGLLKMPDVYMRLSASTIAGTFGVASMLLAVAVHFGSFYVGLHILGVIIFLMLTVPISAHMLGRTAHVIGLKMWEKTLCDDLEGKLDDETLLYDGECIMEDKDPQEPESFTPGNEDDEDDEDDDDE